MGTTFVERRAVRNGSIVCDNGFASLRIIRSDLSLELALDAVDSGAGNVSLQYAPNGSSCRVVGPAGERLALQFFAFDPIQVDGCTRGVKLLGALGANPATLTVLLDTSSAWCQIRFEVQPRTPITIKRLTHGWRLSPDWDEPDVYWPREAVYHEHLSETPAAFFQLGPLFAALIPDLEDGDPALLGGRISTEDELKLEYGVMGQGNHTFTLDTPLRLAYALCLDTHAMPEYGYQEIVRALGAGDALRLASVPPTRAVSGALPLLPPAPDSPAWIPFTQEGTPEEIAALVQDYFSNAGEHDWHSLDLGLRWLDRLCLQQHLTEVPNGLPYGSIGHGPDWTRVAFWMPQLLLTAFRLTGIQEYAYRGIAAISALQADARARVLGQLREHFGDIYINTEYSEAVLLTKFEAFRSCITEPLIELHIAGAEQPGPLRLVLEGERQSYRLKINEELLGTLPIAVLREGIELPL